MESKNIYELGRRVIDMFYSKGFSDVNIQFETGPTKGDGVIGKILHAKICAAKEGVPLEFDTVIKCAPIDANFRKTMPVRKLFLRETLYYTKIAPIFENLQDQFELCVPQEMRCFLPKCYGTCDEFKQEIVILEDLTQKGYRVTPLVTLDYDHAAIILRTIAKLHALSFIYEERYPQRFREMAGQCTDIYLITDEEYDETCAIQHGEKTMKQFTDAITDVSLRKRFEMAAGTNALKKFMELTKVGNVKAILHGDNWHGNHMFKYKNGKPTEAIPIDFQWSRYGSIAHDFMYLFIFSVSGDLRRHHFHDLVDEYYAAFKGFLTLCGYDANKFCTYEQFKEELKMQALISIMTFMFATPFIKYPELTLPELLASPDVAYAVTEDYKQSVNDMTTDWTKLGFI